MARADVLRVFEDRAPADRFCDLILTGGVTSSIAYPAVTLALAQSYRLHSIGGASSGAGAAALAAAAEFRRRQGSSVGYLQLKEQVEEVADCFDGRTGLAWLFQPLPAHARLFPLLLGAFATPGRKRGAVLGGALRGYGVEAAVFLAASLALVSMLGPFDGAGRAALAYGVGGLLLTAGLLAAALTIDLLRLAQTDYGVCSGTAVDPRAPRPPLTDWLHGLVQDLAGRDRVAKPLTFADLHAAPGSPRETLGDPSGEALSGIRLQMVTANVTQGRPYLFPLSDDDPPLFFCPREWRQLFPAPIVDHLLRWAVGTGARGEANPRLPKEAGDADDDRLWPLATDELPIVVAARMSVGFPVLFRAVPVWHRTAPSTGAPAHFSRSLLADGGLCSNFPVHLFDSAVPAWPTFGIALRDSRQRRSQPAVDAAMRARCPSCFARPGRPDDGTVAVELPGVLAEGGGERWDRFDDPLAAGPAAWRMPAPGARLGGFIGAMLGTVTDWNDAALARMPGVRERVVTIDLPAGIGGLNILMSPEDIRCLAELGLEAGRLLLARYAEPAGSTGQPAGWAEHRWVRFQTFGRALEETVRGLSWSVRLARYVQPLDQQIAAAMADSPLLDRTAPAGSPVRATPALLVAQAAQLQRTLEALSALERLVGRSDDAGPPFKPHPMPSLRVRPPM